MPYGTIKIDTITFTDGGVDKSVPVSGLVLNPTFTGNVTVTGTISGNTIQGGTIVSGLTVTGTTANFASGVFSTQVSGVTITGTTVAATTGTFTSLTGTTTNGTTASFTTGNFTSLTGTTTTGTTANFASGVFTTQVSGLLITGPTVSATTGTFTSLTGTTTTGTTANFVSGVFTTQISGVTITGTTVSTTTGNFISLTGTTATITSGIIASGTAALPSLAILSDSDTGIFSPGADQLAISTGGSGRLFVDANGNIGLGTSSPTNFTNYQTLALNDTDGSFIDFKVNGTLAHGIVADFNQLLIKSISGLPVTFGTNDIERLRITSTGDLNFKGAGTQGVTQAVSFNGSAPVNSMVLTSGGLLGIGDSAPESILHLKGSNAVLKIESSVNTGYSGVEFDRAADDTHFAIYAYDASHPSQANNVQFYGYQNGSIQFFTNNTERTRIRADGMFEVKGAGTAGSSPAFSVNGSAPANSAVIDTSGRLLVGTSSSYAADDSKLQVLVTRADSLGGISLTNNQWYGAGTRILFQNAINSAGTITPVAAITGEGDGENKGRLVFSTTADGASSPTPRMTITSNGAIRIAQNTTDDPGASNIAGIGFGPSGFASFSRTQGAALLVNRTFDDGALVAFRQDGTDEGSITVSGTTVSYNGAHLSRWSQLASGAERTEILRGSVLSNLDEMCEWGEEENEQLNRMKVSDVEGDKNVSGVFQCWDDDDDTYTNDFYCAMTGDFIIRIAADVTVERGDLLISAGDGTAKPQDDDIIRSKTIAKVTSTNVSCTYDDGSYCVPCVLMAC